MPTPHDSAWQSVSNVPPLGQRDIHIWRFSLVTDSVRMTAMRDTLDDYELRRADRFLFDKHRHRFVVGRARVRDLLACYLNTDSASIEFAYSNLGKPKIANPARQFTLHFNFSNSAELGLLAVTHVGELGIDLEQVRDMSDLEGLAKRYFASAESEAIFARPQADQRMQAFFRFWTRKEAYLKAVGKGLTFPLRDVEVSLDDDSRARIVAINSKDDDALQWSLGHLDLGDDYLGAFAIRSSQLQVQTLELDAHTDSSNSTIGD